MAGVEVLKRKIDLIEETTENVVKNDGVIEKEDKLILEMLEMNEEVALKEDMKKVVEISLNTKVASELFTEKQIIW